MSEQPLMMPDAADLSVTRIEHCATGLVIPFDLSWDEYDREQQLLGRIDHARQWWRGDLLNFGEHKFGEKYTQAVDEGGTTVRSRP
ncbi:MAG: hypothetical protein LC798_19855 [Chloroflexi bacterium]|nr:hypothetical protein [Chloroflexota bacterium]